MGAGYSGAVMRLREYALVVGPWATAGAAIALAWAGVPVWPLAAGAALVAAVCMALAWRSARDATRAAEELGALAREHLESMAGGDDGVQGTVRSIRARMSSQMKELAKKTRNLESLMDALGEPLLVTDDADDVLMCNRAAEGMLGAGRGGLTGRNVRELFTRQQVLDLHAQARQGRTVAAQVPMTTQAGPRTFQVTASPLPPAWGEGVFGVVLVMQDVTALAQSARMRTDFVASASHELRTPVAAIQAAAETLGDGGADDPVMRDRLLGMIAAHCQRLERLTRNLIELSRLESPELPVKTEVLNWEGLEAGLEAGFETALEARGQRLEWEIDEAVRSGGWRSDGALLDLILRNLIENAAKFGHEGRPIRVRARLVGRAGARVGGSSPGPAREGSRRDVLRLEVIDEGIGIPLEHQGRVFERFYQVDPSRTGGTPGSGPKRGTGLGLSLVKHAAAALGGKVGLESVWGRGTTVWVEVPVEG